MRLDDRVTIATPEGVTLELILAGLGSRFIARLLDSVIQGAIILALFIGGGVSNWIDRLLHGRVVDFLNVGIGSLRTGIFNVADVAIMAAVAMLVLPELWTRDRGTNGGGRGQ